jgi:hypothetical protein
MIGRLKAAPLLLLALLGCRSSEQGSAPAALDAPQGEPSGRSAPASLDPRLSAFLAVVIKDPVALEKEKRDYAARNVSFEQFIYFVYTGAIKIDQTPDNAKALAELGEYLEKQRPSLSPQLTTQMEEFYSVETNQTFMRGMFLETIRGLTKSH